MREEVTYRIRSGSAASPLAALQSYIISNLAVKGLTALPLALLLFIASNVSHAASCVTTWQALNDADLSHYVVAYGNTSRTDNIHPDSFDYSYTLNTNNTTASLSGLSDISETYISVYAVSNSGRRTFFSTELVLNPNMVSNASFENGDPNPNSWALGNASSLSNSNSYSGSKSLYMNAGSSPTTQTINLQPNTLYLLSFRVDASAMSAGTAVVDTNDVFDPGRTPGGDGQKVIRPGDADGWTKFTGSFNSAGESSVTLRIFANNLVGEVFFDDIFLAPVTPFGLWSAENDVIDANADNDADGLSNLMEYALGGNPRNAALSERPAFLRNVGGFSFSFKRDQAAVSYTLQRSGDLITWEDYRSISDVYGAVGTTAIVPIPDADMLSGKVFLRLKIEE